MWFLTPVCTFLWADSSNERLYVLLQMLHEYGRSFVCVFMCRFNSFVVVHILLQISHLILLAAVCVFMWKLRLVPAVKLFPHSVHKWGLIPVCIFFCSATCLLSQVLPQTMLFSASVTDLTHLFCWHKAFETLLVLLFVVTSCLLPFGDLEKNTRHLLNATLLVYLLPIPAVYNRYKHKQICDFFKTFWNMFITTWKSNDKLKTNILSSAVQK